MAGGLLGGMAGSAIGGATVDALGRPVAPNDPFNLMGGSAGPGRSANNAGGDGAQASEPGPSEWTIMAPPEVLVY